MKKKAHLETEYGNYNLSRSNIVGREGNFVALPHSTKKQGVSGLHLEINFSNKEDRWSIKRLSDREGITKIKKKESGDIVVLVKGQRTWIEDGDEILLGNEVLVFREGKSQTQGTYLHRDLYQWISVLEQTGHCGIVLGEIPSDVDLISYTRNVVADILEKEFYHVNVIFWENISKEIEEELLSNQVCFSSFSMHGKLGQRVPRLVIKVDSKEEQSFDSTTQFIFEMTMKHLSLISDQQLWNKGAKISEIIGKSSLMEQVRKKILRFAPTQVPILITGEKGTEKELVAQAIHANSSRYSYNFISQDCTTKPDAYLEKELFGYGEETETGIYLERKGFFEWAHQGTLFLDEITDLSLDMQVDLLHVSDKKWICRVGENQEIPVDVRIVCGSSENIEENMEEGEVRGDFYHQINGMEIYLPPLRERKEDIPLWINHFIQKYSSNSLFELSSPAKQILENYSWPGNIEELERVIKHLAHIEIPELVEKKVMAYISDQKKKTLAFRKKSFEDVLPFLAIDLKRHFLQQEILSKLQYEKMAGCRNGRPQLKKLVYWKWLEKEEKNEYKKGAELGQYYCLNLRCSLCEYSVKLNQFAIPSSDFSDLGPMQTEEYSFWDKALFFCSKCKKKAQKVKGVARKSFLT